MWAVVFEGMQSIPCRTVHPQKLAAICSSNIKQRSLTCFAIFPLVLEKNKTEESRNGGRKVPWKHSRSLAKYFMSLIQIPFDAMRIRNKCIGPFLKKYAFYITFCPLWTAILFSLMQQSA